jgi:tetratricopeptide (TPR) repeat protein
MAKEIKNEKAEAVVEAVSKTEQFFEKNGKTISYAAIAVVVVIAAVFCWNKFIHQPKVAEAQGQMAWAEENFRNAADSTGYALALYGDGNVLGFEQIAKEYGAKAGKAVNFYAGVCEYNLKNYESAVKYLKAYNGNDVILAARALACIGDCYVNMEDYQTALTYFEKAAAASDNLFAAEYLLDAGLVAEKLGENEKALGYYKQIKENYAAAPQAYDIDKYISRIEAK